MIKPNDIAVISESRGRTDTEEIRTAFFDFVLYFIGAVYLGSVMSRKVGVAGMPLTPIFSPMSFGARSRGRFQIGTLSIRVAILESFGMG